MLLPIDPWDPDCEVYAETTSIVSIRREKRFGSWKAIGYLSGPRTEREDDKNESGSHCAYFTMREGAKFVVALTEKESFRDLTAYLSGIEVCKGSGEKPSGGAMNTVCVEPLQGILDRTVNEIIAQAKTKRTCPSCKGRGFLQDVTCHECKGAGKVP